MSDIIVSAKGLLSWNNKEYKCALGKGGVALDKREGDDATPLGCFPIRNILYRSDRLGKPLTSIPTESITPNDGWCDDPNNQEYNKHVTLPHPASHERLWREDNLYDLIVILGYNDEPPVPGKGSAIFMHVARQTYTPTAGCIALALSDLLEIIATINQETQVCIQA